MRLKGNHSDRFRSLNTDGENQWLHGQRRDVTYVTRLQGLQAAVDSQLQELVKDHPNRRVALVTFNSEVNNDLHSKLLIRLCKKFYFEEFYKL